MSLPLSRTPDEGDSRTPGLEYGESLNGRAAHIFNDADERGDYSYCGVFLVRGVTDKTAWTRCQKCEKATRP